MVVLQRGDRLKAISFQGGEFDPNHLMVPITDETASEIGNEKFVAMIDAIRGR
jgi:hypothetical protein